MGKKRMAGIINNTNNSNEGLTPFSNKFIYNCRDLNGWEYKIATTISSFGYQKADGTFNDCCPSQETIAYLINLSVRQTQRYIDSLKEKGWIKVIRRGYKTNIYVFLKEVRGVIDANIKIAKEIAKQKAEVATERAKGLKKTYGNKAKNKGHFNNFEQREYDLSPNGSMEFKLLGWDKLE